VLFENHEQHPQQMKIKRHCIYFLIHRVAEEERSVFWEVIVSVILSKKKCIYTCVFSERFRRQLFHCTVHCTLGRRAKRLVLTRIAKYIDADGGIFENCTNFVTRTINICIRNST
jgi:hypothetical protein